MTGTAKQEPTNFEKTYDIDVIEIPTNKNPFPPKRSSGSGLCNSNQSKIMASLEAVRNALT